MSPAQNNLSFNLTMNLERALERACDLALLDLARLLLGIKRHGDGSSGKNISLLVHIFLLLIDRGLGARDAEHVGGA